MYQPKRECGAVVAIYRPRGHSRRDEVQIIVWYDDIGSAESLTVPPQPVQIVLEHNA